MAIGEAQAGRLRARERWQSEKSLSAKPGLGQRLAAALFPSGRLPELDGVRGLAVLMVVAMHFWLMAGSPRLPVAPLRGLDVSFLFSGGMVGVNLFFVLSGFMLFLPWAKARARGQPPPTARRYLARRVLRIIPAYYVNLLAIVLLIGPASVYASNIPVPMDLAAHFLFVHNLSPLTHQSINGVAWTLAVEAQFYLVLPLLAPLALRLGPVRTALAGVVAAIIWRLLARLALGTQDPEVLWMVAEQLPGELDQFAMGVASAMLWVEVQVTRWTAGSHAWQGAGLLGFGSLVIVAALYRLHACDCVFGQGARDLAWWNSAVGLGCTALMLGSLTAWRPLRSLLASRPLRLVGVAGYGTFLWHFQVADFLDRHGLLAGLASGGEQLVRLFLLAAPLAVLMGVLSWLLIERPCLDVRLGARVRDVVRPLSRF